MTGAADTVIGVLAATLAAVTEEACYCENAAAGVVGKLTSTAAQVELETRGMWVDTGLAS